MVRPLLIAQLFAYQRNELLGFCIDEASRLLRIGVHYYNGKSDWGNRVAFGKVITAVSGGIFIPTNVSEPRRCSSGSPRSSS